MFRYVWYYQPFLFCLFPPFPLPHYLYLLAPDAVQVPDPQRETQIGKALDGSTNAAIKNHGVLHQFDQMFNVLPSFWNFYENKKGFRYQSWHLFFCIGLLFSRHAIICSFDQPTNLNRFATSIASRIVYWKWKLLRKHRNNNTSGL